MTVFTGRLLSQRKASYRVTAFGEPQLSTEGASGVMRVTAFMP